MDNVDTKIITDGTIEEFILELRRLYNNESITYEITEEGKYVIKNGEKYIFEINRGVNIGDALNTISSDTIIVNELSQTNTPTYQQTDVNKLNTNYQGTTGTYDYNINVDVDVYNEIISIYNNLIEDLRKSKKHFKPRVMTGELRTYYDSVVQENDIDQIIDNLIIDFEDIIIRIETAVNTYQTLDDELALQLNSIIATIFTIDKVELTNSGSTLKERQESLDIMIDSLESDLRMFQSQYSALLSVDKTEMDKVFHLFDALKMDNINYDAVYDKETGSYNIIELGKMVNYLQENDVFYKLDNYFNHEISWQESGMEELFGDNIRNYYWLYENRSFNASEDATLDTEVLFLQNYMNGFYPNENEIFRGTLEGIDNLTEHMYLYGNYCLEKYEGLKYYDDYFFEEDLKVKDDFDLTYEEWLEKWEENQKEYYNTHQNEIQIDGYNSYDEYKKSLIKNDEQTVYNHINAWFTDDYMNLNANGKYYYNYKLNTINGWEKDLALKMIKSYVSNNGTLETIDSAEKKYEKSITLSMNIATSSIKLRNYKQYRELIPFEDYKNDITYKNEYLTKDYINYENDYLKEYFGKDWKKYLDKSEVALFDYLYSTADDNDKYKAVAYLKAMEDVVTQRKGVSEAIEYVEELNEQHGGDIGTLVRYGPGVFLLSVLFREQYDTIADTGIALKEGFIDGNANFFDGWYDLFCSDGEISEKDYENMYKMQLLMSDNEYTSNLSQLEREWLSGSYQLGNSIGYMTFPTLVSYVPIVGKPASFIGITGASTGNSIEDLRQQEVDKNQAYLYGTMLGFSESAIEMLFNGLPGDADNAANSGLDFAKSLLIEAGEEGITTYTNEFIECFATGEPFDIEKTSADAREAALMAIYHAGAMNAGGRIALKALNTVIKSSPSEFDTYEEWRESIENDFRKADPTLANLLMGKSRNGNSGVYLLQVNREEIPADASMQGLISNLKYNTETSSYQVTLINGNTFDVPNLDMVTNNYLKANFMATKQNPADILKGLNRKPNLYDKKGQGVNPEVQTETVVDPNADEVTLKESDATLEEVTPSLDGTVMGDTLVETEPTDGTIGISSLPGTLMGTIGFLGDKVKTFGGEVAGLTTDALTSFNEFVSNIIGGIKANAAKTQIGKLSGNELVIYMDTLDATMLTRKVKGADGKEITLLEYAWENGFEIVYDFFDNGKNIPNAAYSSVEVAKIVIEQGDSVSGGVGNFVGNLDEPMLTKAVTGTDGKEVTLLEYAWKNGYATTIDGKTYFGIPKCTKTSTAVAKICIDNYENIYHIFDLVCGSDSNIRTAELVDSNGNVVPILRYVFEVVPPEKRVITADFDKANLDLPYDPKTFSADDVMLVRSTDIFPHNHTIRSLYSTIKSETTNPQYYDWNQSPSGIAASNGALGRMMYRQTTHFAANGLVAEVEGNNWKNKPFIILEPLKYHVEGERIRGSAVDLYYNHDIKLSDDAIVMVRKDYYEANKDSIPPGYNIVLFEGEDTSNCINSLLYKLGYKPQGMSKNISGGVPSENTVENNRYMIKDYLDKNSADYDFGNHYNYKDNPSSFDAYFEYYYTFKHQAYYELHNKPVDMNQNIKLTEDEFLYLWENDKHPARFTPKEVKNFMLESGYRYDVATNQFYSVDYQEFMQRNEANSRGELANDEFEMVTEFLEPYIPKIKQMQDEKRQQMNQEQYQKYDNMTPEEARESITNEYQNEDIYRDHSISYYNEKYQELHPSIPFAENSFIFDNRFYSEEVVGAILEKNEEYLKNLRKHVDDNGNIIYEVVFPDDVPPEQLESLYQSITSTLFWHSNECK